MRYLSDLQQEESILIHNISKAQHIIYLFKEIGVSNIEKTLFYILFHIGDNIIIKPRFDKDIMNELNKRQTLKDLDQKLIKTIENVNKFNDLIKELSKDFYVITIENVSPYEAYDYYKENDQIRSWENVRFTKFVRKYFDATELSKLEVKKEIEKDNEDIETLILLVTNTEGENLEATILEVETYDDIEAKYRRKGASARVKKPVVPIKILVTHPKTGTPFYRTYYVARDKLKYYREMELKAKEKGEQPRYVTSASEIDASFRDPKQSTSVKEFYSALDGKVRRNRMPNNGAILSGSYFYMRDKFVEAIGTRQKVLDVIRPVASTSIGKGKGEIKTVVKFEDRRTNKQLGVISSRVRFKERDANTVDFTYNYSLSGVLDSAKLRDVLNTNATFDPVSKNVSVEGYIRVGQDKGGNPLPYMNISKITSKGIDISMKELAYLTLVNRNLVDMIFVDINGIRPDMVAKLLALGFTIPDNKKVFASYKNQIRERVKRWKELVNDYRKRNQSNLITELTDSDIKAVETALNKSSTLKEFQLELLRNRFDKFYLLFEELGIARDYINYINKRYEKDIAEGKRKPVNKLV